MFEDSTDSSTRQPFNLLTYQLINTLNHTNPKIIFNHDTF